MENKNKTVELLPDNIVAFLGFVDILFAALIAYVIAELPIIALHNTEVKYVVLFFLLYFPNLIKMVLHWWSIHFDLPLAEKFMENRTVPIIYYFAAVMEAAWYVTFAKLLNIWVASNDHFYFIVAFIIMTVFRIFDILINIIVLPRLAKKRTDEDIEGNALVTSWYTKKHPKFYFLYLIHISLGITIMFSDPKNYFLLGCLYILAEILIESIIYSGRRKFYPVIEKKVGP